MKKFLSILLVVSFVLSMTTSMSLAYDSSDVTVEETVMYNSDGEALKFRLKTVGNDQYEMEFYIEDELIRTYDMDMTSSDPFTVIDHSSNEISTLERAEPQKVLNTESVKGPIRWTDLGYIHYARSSTLGAETCAPVVSRATDSYEDQYVIDTNVSRKVDELVTFVAGALLGSAMPTPAAGWLGVAQLLVEAAISAVGADVIGDTISAPFKEYYYCVVTEYELAGTVGGKGNGISGERASFTGAKYSVEYQSDVFNDSYTGYTPYTWKTTEFAIDLWMESMPGIAYPGYIGFPTRYPL